jgi:dienelactone hydrolase
VTLVVSPQPPDVVADPGHRVQPRPSVLEGAAGAAGLALAALVAYEGTPGWQIGRVAAVAGVTAGVIVMQRRASPRWRGRLSVLFGVPMLAIGLGFGPYLTKGGPVVVRAAAVVLAVASLGLVVGGTVVATRPHRLVVRLAEAAGVLVALAVAGFVIGPAVAVTNVPPMEVGATPSAVDLVYEDVSLRTDDGVPLAAWYVPSSGTAAVVLLHGAGSTRSDVLDEAIVLADAGFGVLLVDARGHGASGGRAMDFGWYGDADIAAATAYLAGRPDIDTDGIGIVGLSMGGEEALGASGSNELIRAVVAEGATARTAADEDWLSDEFGIRGLVQEQLERAQDWVTGLLTDASAPSSLRDAVEASNGTRYLLITAGQVAEEGRAASYIAAAAPDRVEVWTVPGAGHTGGLETASEEWAARVTDFLRDTLLHDTR